MKKIIFVHLARKRPTILFPSLLTKLEFPGENATLLNCYPNITTEMHRPANLHLLRITVVDCCCVLGVGGSDSSCLRELVPRSSIE